MNQGQFLQSIQEEETRTGFALHFTLPTLQTYYSRLIRRMSGEDPARSQTYWLPLVFADWATKTLLQDEVAVFLEDALPPLGSSRLFDGIDNSIMSTPFALGNPRADGGRWTLDVLPVPDQPERTLNSIFFGPHLPPDAITDWMEKRVVSGSSTRLFGYMAPSDIADLRKALHGRFPTQAMRYWSKVKSVPDPRVQNPKRHHHFFYLET